MRKKTKTVKLKFKHTLIQNEDGTEGDLIHLTNPEDSDEEWDMIEEVFNTFVEEQD